MFDELYEIFEMITCLSFPSSVPIASRTGSNKKKSFDINIQDSKYSDTGSPFSSTGLSNTSSEVSRISSSRNRFAFKMHIKSISEQLTIRFSIRSQENYNELIQKVAKYINNSIKIGRVNIKKNKIIYLEFFYASSLTINTISAFLETVNKMQKIFKRYCLELVGQLPEAELPEDMFRNLKNLSKVKLFQKYSVIEYKNTEECEKDLKIIKEFLKKEKLKEYFFRFEVLFSGMRKLKFLIAQGVVKLHKKRSVSGNMNSQIQHLFEILGKEKIRILDQNLLLSMLYLYNESLLIIPNIPLFKIFEVTNTYQESELVIKDNDYEPEILSIDEIQESRLNKSGKYSIIGIDLKMGFEKTQNNPESSRSHYIERMYDFKHLYHDNFVKVYGFCIGEKNKLNAVTEDFCYNSLISAFDLSKKPKDLVKVIIELIQLINFSEAVGYNLPLFINCFCLDYSKYTAKVVPSHRLEDYLIPYLTYEEILSLKDENLQNSIVNKRIVRHLHLSKDMAYLDELDKNIFNVAVKSTDINGESTEIYRLGLLIYELISRKNRLRPKPNEISLKIQAEKLLIDRRVPIIESEANHNSFLVGIIREMSSVIPQHRISMTALKKLLMIDSKISDDSSKASR